MLKHLLIIIGALTLLATATFANATPGKGDGAADPAANKSSSMKRDAAKEGKTVRKQAMDTAERKQAKEKSERAAEGKGPETAREMQARRDERKQIQEEYRESSEQGPRPGKKPWWKFWASSDDE